MSPTEIETELTNGRTLTTVDIPTYLNRQLICETGTGLSLYRLIQLFGALNVPTGQAGASQAERSMTTWHYLFHAVFDPVLNVSESIEFLLSLYDYKTNVSVGLSAWTKKQDETGTVLEPSSDTTTVAIITQASEEFLEGIIQLVFNIIEESVQATYKNLWT